MKTSLSLLLSAWAACGTAFLCPGGLDSKSVHLQIEFDVNMASWVDRDEREAYRRGLVTAIYDLGSAYGPQTDVQVAAFSDMKTTGAGMCTKLVTPDFRKPVEASAALTAFFEEYGWSTSYRTHDDGSLSSALRFGLQNPAWNRDQLDADGKPIVRVFSSVNGLNFAIGDHSPWAPDVLPADPDACQSFEPPTEEQLRVDGAAFPDPTYFTFLERVQATSNYENDVLLDLLGHKGKSVMVDNMANHIEIQMNLIKGAVCDYLDSITTTTTPTPSTPVPTAIGAFTTLGIDEVCEGCSCERLLEEFLLSLE